MGIMNKMKTVAVKDLTWLKGDNFFNADTSNLPIKYVAISETGIIKCDGYTVTNLVALNRLDNSIAVSDASRHCIRIRVSNQDSTSVEAFLASEGDKTITYETVDSVEEKIINSMGTKAVPTWSYDQTYAYIFLHDRKPGSNVKYSWNKPLPSNLLFRFNSDNLGCVLAFLHADYPTRASINAVMADKVITYQLNTDTTEEII